MKFRLKKGTPPPTVQVPNLIAEGPILGQMGPVSFFPDLEDVVPVKAPAPTKDNFPTNTIVREEGHPRRVKVYGPIWIELLASQDDDLISKARNILYTVPLSTYVLLDKENGDKMLMTTDTFYSDARRLLLEKGYSIWGVK